MINRSLFSSITDKWSTPEDLYTALDREFGFTLDPCPLDGSVDGLSPFCIWAGQRAFCNPPYGRQIRKWLERAFEADIAVYLLPARTDTRWFHEIVLPHATEIRFVRGRLKFGHAKDRAPFPSVILVFDNRRAAECLSPHTVALSGEQSHEYPQWFPPSSLR